MRTKLNVKWIYSKIILLPAIFTIAFPSMGQNEQTRLENIKPLHSAGWWDGTTFGFGTFFDQPLPRTANRYSPSLSPPGFSISFDQKIRGMWSGGLVFRWSQWERTNWNYVPFGEGDVRSGVKYDELPSAYKSKTSDIISPLSILTRVEAAPHFEFLKNYNLSDVIRPFATGGVGYLAFTRSRKLYPVDRDDMEHSEALVDFGVGVRLALSKSVGLRLGAEYWRGVKTFNYNGIFYQADLLFGDVEGR